MQTVNVTESVIYHRQGKTFAARLGETKIGEADTRADAELALIEAITPDLARRVRYVYQRAGEVAGRRAHRGAKLVLAGKVREAEDGDGWIVDSETEAGKVYHVRYDRGDDFGPWQCECEDHINGIRGDRWGAPLVDGHGFLCKHILATKLYGGMEKGERQQSQPADALVAAESQATNGHKSIAESWAVKSRTIRDGRQQRDVVEGTFGRKGDAEAFAHELAIDIRDTWPALLRRFHGNFRLVRGNTETYLWIEEATK